MKSSKKNRLFDSYLLKGKLRRSGYEKIRYIFSGVNRLTGEKKSFFVELYYVNPLVSPDTPVLAQKFRPVVSPQDVQYALSGVSSVKGSYGETDVLPSYALVKAGVFGTDGRQFNSFLPANSVHYDKSENSIYAGECKFGFDSLKGSVRVTREDLENRPELYCSAGNIEWNLNFEKITDVCVLNDADGQIWIPGGAKTVFSGSVIVDGESYTVIPKSSSGYIDKSWGEKPVNPYYHLSSSNLISAITGKSLLKSCFAIEGEFDSRLCIYVCIEGNVITLKGKSLFCKYSEIHDWVEMPQDADGKKLHWTVSVQYKKYVIDFDLYCRIDEMFVRDYEMPYGKNEMQKILGGGTGFGEVRIYKKVKKNLELIDHINTLDVLCEYGSTDKN